MHLKSRKDRTRIPRIIKRMINRFLLQEGTQLRRIHHMWHSIIWIKRKKGRWDKEKYWLRPPWYRNHWGSSIVFPHSFWPFLDRCRFCNNLLSICLAVDCIGTVYPVKFDPSGGKCEKKNKDNSIYLGSYVRNHMFHDDVGTTRGGTSKLQQDPKLMFFCRILRIILMIDDNLYLKIF